MCDISFEKIYKLASLNLQQYDSSRLKTVAVVSTVVAFTGLSYIGLRLCNRPKSSLDDSERNNFKSGSHVGPNIPARGALSHERGRAENTLQVLNEGTDGKAASCSCLCCDNQASIDVGCPDCRQVLYCSESCWHLHEREHQASCTRLVESIDQAILSYLFNRPNECLEKCDAALGRLCLGCRSDINNSTPFAQPLLLDLHGLIQARRRQPQKSIRSFQAALLKLREASLQPPDTCYTSRDDLIVMDTRGYLAPNSFLSQRDHEHFKARIGLHLARVQLELNSSSLEAVGPDIRACIEASMHMGDALAAISLPARLKAAELQCAWVPYIYLQSWFLTLLRALSMRMPGATVPAHAIVSLSCRNMHCRLGEFPARHLEEGLASMARVLVSKLDEDHVSATVAAQLLLGAAMPLCKYYIKSRAFQCAAAVLLHATAFAPFLPQSTASALLRLAHNCFEQERSAAGPAVEYDCRVLSAAVEAACDAPIASGSLMRCLIAPEKTASNSQKASAVGMATAAATASATSEHTHTLQKPSGPAVPPRPGAGDRVAGSESLHGGAVTNYAPPVTPKRMCTVDAGRGSPCAILLRRVTPPSTVHGLIADSTGVGALGRCRVQSIDSLHHASSLLVRE